jgi:hypothetical protein
MPAPFDLFSPFKYFNVAPVTDWERFVNPQFNVTINQGDAAVENRVLAAAGSYGRQLGRMQEVLDVLIARLPAGELTAVQARSIEKYRELRTSVVTAVEAAKPGGEARADQEDVEAWLDRLARLRDTDPERFDRLKSRIGQVLSPGGGTQAPPRTSARRGR